MAKFFDFFTIFSLSKIYAHKKLGNFSLYIVLLFAEPYTGDFIASRIPLIQAQSIMDETYYGDGWSSENERELSEIRLVP